MGIVDETRTEAASYNKRSYVLRKPRNLYWLAVLARLKSTLETCGLPELVCSEIRGIMLTRWRGFFIEGPTNVYLSAFFLNPGVC
jgi:hypothetical protein